MSKESMSQRIYTHRTTKGIITVNAGWDRPLHYSFLVVQIESRATPLYTNLSDPEGCDVHPDKCRQILERLEIPIPEGFIEQLNEDRIMKPGNLYSDFGEI
jgi:hypothetical protein